MSLTEVDWSTLPAPVNDGGAAHLVGNRLPSVELRATNGATVIPAELSGIAVLFCYPMTGRPDRDLPDGWDQIAGARGCTPQNCAYRDHYADLTALGAANIFGISTQSTDDQEEAVARLHLPYPLLSDADLKLANGAELPVMEVDGLVMLKRLTLILRGGVVEHINYPVFPPDQDATWVAAKLKGMT